VRAPPTVYALLVAYVAGLLGALAWRPSPAATVALLGVTTGWALLRLTLPVEPDARPTPTGAERRLPASPWRGRLRASAWRPRLRASAAVALAPLVVAAGLTVGAARLDAQARSELTRFVGHTVTLQATALTLPKVGDERVSLDVKVTAVDGAVVAERAPLTLDLGGAPAPAFTSLGPLVEGTCLRLAAAQVEALPRAKPGEFDYGRYLERRGEHVVLAAPLATLRLTGRRGGLGGFVDRLRLAARGHIRRGLRSPVREVLEAMVLGDQQAVPDGPVTDMRRSGLLHILAVSGENVVLLCTMGSFVLTLAGVRRGVRSLILIPSVVLYVVVTGATPSIVRAGVSGVVALLANLTSRPTDGWFLWLVPGAFMLTRSPAVVFDVSFQLSFAAVAGLLLLGRPLTHALAFAPRFLGEPAAITTAASLSTAPVSMATFGQASLVAVPANIVGGFVLGPIMFLGMLSVFVGFAWPALSAPLNVVAGLFTGFLLTVAGWFGHPSFAVYTWQGLTLGFLVAALLGGGLVVVALLAHRAGESLRDYARVPRRRGRIAVAAVVLIAAALAMAPARPAAPARPTLTVLSVGEGAAALLQEPGGPTVLIDAGPTPLAACLRRHGVRHINLLVLSHGHADHTAGLSDVLGQIPIDQALVPQPVVASAALNRVVAELRAARVPVHACTARLSLTIGGGRLAVVPTGTPGGADNQDENDCALVVVVTLDGESVLLPGDAEAEALEPLDLGPLAIVELPHHGSSGGLDDRLLAEYRPRLAVVSVGPNKFGHPTASSLALMAGHGVPLLRTDFSGDITLTAGPTGLLVAAAHPGRALAAARSP
jgi:competence protein ComEC